MKLQKIPFLDSASLTSTISTKGEMRHVITQPNKVFSGFIKWCIKKWNTPTEPVPVWKKKK